MQIETTRFGTLEVPAEEVIRFKRGVLGFESVKGYVLLPHGEESPFQFLQAVDQPDLTFIVTDPRWFRPDYRVEVYQEDLEQLESTAEDSIVVAAIVTVPAGSGEMTANLLAPLLIDAESHLGIQIVQAESQYKTRHSIQEELDRAGRMTKNAAKNKEAALKVVV